MWRFAFFSALLISICCLGCGGYGEVSPKTYELAQSLYNVSNRKLTDKLDAVAKQIESAREQDEISAKEAKWLSTILKQAENERWSEAMADARRIMEDQVK